jgi:hypothetical protein
VTEAENLHVPCESHAKEDADAHGHPAYGVYDERNQSITLDAHLPFERRRETFVHENLHAMFSAGSLDTVLNGEAVGLDEHIISVLSPILLSWMRDNPRAVAFVSETQT